MCGLSRIPVPDLHGRAARVRSVMSHSGPLDVLDGDGLDYVDPESANLLARIESEALARQRQVIYNFKEEREGLMSIFQIHPFVHHTHH